VIAKLHGPPPWRWDVTPDGARLVVAHGAGAIVAITTATGASRELVASAAPMSVNGVACLGNAGELVIAGALKDGDQVQRLGADGRRTTIWTSADEAVSRLRTIDSTVWIETDAWTHSYWLREAP
jgi:hypothetical protein